MSTRTLRNQIEKLKAKVPGPAAAQWQGLPVLLDNSLPQRATDAQYAANVMHQLGYPKIEVMQDGRDAHIYRDGQWHKPTALIGDILRLHPHLSHHRARTIADTIVALSV